MESLRPLDVVEQRVLGALLEKERTVPSTYPMTLNGLRTACNQSSGRDPVLRLGEEEIADAIDRLKRIGLARVVHASHGARTVKYRQVLDERLEIDDPAELAVLTLLLLRGAQTMGELRTRSDRLHEFPDLEAVEKALRVLAEREGPLVRSLPRRPGQKEVRWIHLLGPSDDALDGDTAESGSGGERRSGPAAPPGSATEGLLRDGPGRRTERVRTAYDAAARAYSEQYEDSLDHLPFDRWLLERIVHLANGAPIADIGCGGGRTTLHLAAAGGEVTGYDLSPAMVAEARARHPDLRFEEGDFTMLPGLTVGEGLGAIVGWYALVHLAASELPPAIAILTAALRPGGWLALSVHLGDEIRRVTDLYGVGVDIDFAFHRREALLVAFDAAGLTEVEWYERGPRRGVEARNNRLFVLGRRPVG